MGRDLEPGKLEGVLAALTDWSVILLYIAVNMQEEKGGIDLQSQGLDDLFRSLHTRCQTQRDCCSICYAKTTSAGIRKTVASQPKRRT